MEVSEEIQFMTMAASGNGALSRDAIHSLGSLAAGRDKTSRYLEDVLEEFYLQETGERTKLSRLKGALQNCACLN